LYICKYICTINLLSQILSWAFCGHFVGDSTYHVVTSDGPGQHRPYWCQPACHASRGRLARVCAAAAACAGRPGPAVPSSSRKLCLTAAPDGLSLTLDFWFATRWNRSLGGGAGPWPGPPQSASASRFGRLVSALTRGLPAGRPRVCPSWGARADRLLRKTGPSHGAAQSGGRLWRRWAGDE
jgi:hypothetical protein